MKPSNRTRNIMIFFGLLFFTLIAKLFHLQVIDKNYKTKASNVAIVRESIVPSRGLIYDRNDSLIVYNSAVYDVYITYNKYEKNDSTRLANFLQLKTSTLQEKLQEAVHKGYYKKPFLLLAGLPQKDYARMQEDFYLYDYLSVVSNTERRYKHQNAAIILGYMSKVDENEILNSNGYYVGTDNIGKTGIEKYYEDTLRGKKGLQLLLKDQYGVVQGTFKEGNLDVDAESGKDITTTLDIELQAYAEQLMHGKVGSIVAIEPSTGEIVTMVSSPTYKPEWMIGRARGDYFAAMINDSLKPMFNRAVSAQYAPGSTYKPIASLIGLQVGAVSKDFRFPCSGGYSLNRGKPGCHGHAPLRGVEDAIKQSCNSYYAENFRRTLTHSSFRSIQEALDDWREKSAYFGFTRTYDIGIEGVKSGTFPNSNYFDDLYLKKGGWQWNPFTIISLSIGQGEMEATTLQLAQSVSIIANRGQASQPHLVKQIGNQPVTTETTQIPIDSVYFDYVINGMEYTFIDGTAAASKIPGITACGKTGTAENFARINGKRIQLKDHSLFVCFAPKENPKIALAIMVENGGYGSTYAAPIASLIMEKHINDTIATSRKTIENRMLNARLIDENRDNYLEYIAKQMEQKKIQDSIKQLQ